MPNDHPFADAIRQVALDEWMVGYPADGLSQPVFRPDQRVTPEQIVSVIDNVIENDYPDGMSRGQLADLITDVPWFPDLNWEIVTCEPLPTGAFGSGWCVRVPINKHGRHDNSIISISWTVTDRWWNHWITDPQPRRYTRDLVIPVGSNLSANDAEFDDPQIITIILQYRYVDIQQYGHRHYVRVIRQIIVGDCPNSRLCWHPEIRTETKICRPDDDNADRTCPSGF